MLFTLSFNYCYSQSEGLTSNYRNFSRSDTIGIRYLYWDTTNYDVKPIYEKRGFLIRRIIDPLALNGISEENIEQFFDEKWIRLQSNFIIAYVTIK